MRRSRAGALARTRSGKAALSSDSISFAMTIVDTLARRRRFVLGTSMVTWIHWRRVARAIRTSFVEGVLSVIPISQQLTC